MKNILFLLSAALLVSCAGNQTGPDYSLESMWLVKPQETTHEVDVFYLYPTSASAAGRSIVSRPDSTMRHAAMVSYLKSASAFSPYANVFAPMYRQISGTGIKKCKTPGDLSQMVRKYRTYCDVFAALDYYFENLNGGRPFILASHSQGSCVMKIVLSDYMELHPQYMQRMIAAYAVGFAVTRKWLDDNGLKFAEGETDTGVVITWNTEGPEATKPSLPIAGGTLVINPLNWRRDAVHAGKEMNRGSMEVDERTLEQKPVPGRADAKLDLLRGVVVCSTDSSFIPDSPVFGDRSFHFDDWALFYANVARNGKKRAEAFLGHPIE